MVKVVYLAQYLIFLLILKNKQCLIFFYYCLLYES